ncbi:MAG: hypothetical protein ACI90U_001923 [Pseudomonadales bacterium]|jgi:hypothetical protein
MKISKWPSLRLSQSILDEAYDRSKLLPVLEGSHRGVEANQVGCIGELVVERWFQKHNFSYSSQLKQTSHDYMLNGRTIEVKTKDRTVPPLDKYECSLPDYNHKHQAADYFMFVSLLRDGKYSGENTMYAYKRAYLVGGISHQDFDKHQVFWEEGQTDPTNGTKFWTSCWNVYIKNLEHLSMFSTNFKSDLNVAEH